MNLLLAKRKRKNSDEQLDMLCFIDSQSNSGWNGPPELLESTVLHKAGSAVDQNRFLDLLSQVLKTSKDGNYTTFPILNLENY